MKVQIGEQHFALVRRLQGVLDEEPDRVSQQIAIELLVATHAMRMGDAATAAFVVDSMAKHIKQMMDTVKK